MATETHTPSPTTAQLVEQLSQFDGPPEQFLRALLTVQCRLVAASGAAVLRPGQDGAPQILAVLPEQPEGTAPAWLSPAREVVVDVLKEGHTRVIPIRQPEDLYGAPAHRHAICLPLKSDRKIRGVAVFLLESSDGQVLDTCRERLELTVPLLSLYETQLTLQQRQRQMQQLAATVETNAVVNEQDRFDAAAMALANDLAARWRCERVALGLLKGRYMRVRSLSHTEKFSRKMELIGDIEAAMEECYDQDIEIVTPAPSDARYVSRISEHLARRHGSAAVVSLPLRHKGECIGVLTLQREADQPFGPEEIQALRLTSDLVGPPIYQLSRHDRWFGAKLAGGTRKALATVVGPKHTWLKLGALAVLGVVLFALLGEGDYEVEAPFAISAEKMRFVQTPFEGQLVEANVKPGDQVTAGQVLARLDTEQLEAEQDEWATAREKARLRADQNPNSADAKIAEADAKMAQAKLDQVELRIRQASITAPIDGTVIDGEWDQQVGRMVDKGQQLFVIAQMDEKEAELQVDERDIEEIAKNLEGQLATLARPGDRFDFTVIEVYPMASVENQKNTFKVRVRLNDAPEELKIRQTGVAKIYLRQESHAWLWTHRAIDWVRLKLW